MINQNEFKVLVGLDCILDFRLGAIRLVDIEKWSKVLTEKDNPYFKRVIDDFEWLGEGTTQKVKAILANPTTDLVGASFRTVLMDEIQGLNATIVLESGTSPVFDSVGIYVNIWPLKADETFKDILAGVVSETLSGYRNNQEVVRPYVKVVDIDVNDLTFSKLKNEYNRVYMYDWTKWLAARKEEIVNQGSEMVAVQVGFHVPVLFQTMPDKDKLRLPSGGHLNPFHETKKNLAIWISIEFENPGLFSVADPFSLSDPEKKQIKI